MHETDADLVMMSTDGRNSFLDALRGSHTQRVLKQVPAPLLAVPEGSIAERASKTPASNAPETGAPGRSLGDQQIPSVWGNQPGTVHMDKIIHFSDYAILAAVFVLALRPALLRSPHADAWDQSSFPRHARTTKPHRHSNLRCAP